MRTWERVRIATANCGRCGGRIKVGEPVQIITLPSSKKRFRCQECVGAPDAAQLEAYDTGALSMPWQNLPAAPPAVAPPPPIPEPPRAPPARPAGPLSDLAGKIRERLDARKEASDV